MSIERDSYKFTDAYCELLYAEVRVAAKGAEATPAEINKLNQARMQLNVFDEEIRYMFSERRS
jgi:hypothetical protein